MSEYPITLFWSDQDGGWIADVPDLVSCSAFGRTPQKRLRRC